MHAFGLTNQLHKKTSKINKKIHKKMEDILSSLFYLQFTAVIPKQQWLLVS
jgi:hypothetical protein